MHIVFLGGHSQPDWCSWNLLIFPVLWDTFIYLKTPSTDHLVFNYSDTRTSLIQESNILDSSECPSSVLSELWQELRKPHSPEKKIANAYYHFFSYECKLLLILFSDKDRQNKHFDQSRICMPCVQDVLICFSRVTDMVQWLSDYT